MQTARIGSVEDVRIAGGRLRGTLRFAKTERADEIFRLVADGHLRGVSIGYQVVQAQRDGETDEGLPLFRVTRWRLLESSVTPLPADNAAGIGRSLRGSSMTTTDTDFENDEGNKTRSQRRRENRQRTAENEILDIGEKFNERELAEEIVLSGGTEADLKRAILEKRRNVEPMPRTGGPSFPFDDRMQSFGRPYSPIRRQLLGAFGEDRREQEETAFRAGMWVRAMIYGDDRARRWCSDHLGTRAMGENVFSKGGAVVPVEMSMAIINLAEEHGVARQECQIVPMGTDNVPIPRKTGRPTVYYVGEGNQLTADDAAWDNVNLVARKLAGITQVQ